MKVKSPPVYLQFALLRSCPSPLHLWQEPQMPPQKEARGSDRRCSTYPRPLLGQGQHRGPGRERERSELPPVPLSSVLCFRREVR